MKKKLLFFIFVSLFFPVIANATIYYVANAPSSGNAGWGNGAITNDGLSKSTPFLTIVDALKKMSSSDTLIIDDGIYTGSSNVINRDVTQIPPGTSGNYTKVMAENDGGVIIDGEGVRKCIQIYGNDTVDGDTGRWGTRSNIEIRGIISKNSSGVGISVGYTNHIKLTNVGVVDPADGNLQGINITYSSYVLVEGCYAWGAGRYKIASYHANHTVFRNCVIRFDRADAKNDPMAGFSIYSSTNIEVQNCIAIDGNTSSYWLNMTSDVGAFGAPTTTPTLLSGEINFTNCIALNNHMRFSSTEWNAYAAEANFNNCVGWDMTPSGTLDLIHAQGNANVRNCTFGVVNTGDKTAVTYSWFNGWKTGNTDVSLNNIFYNFKNGGLFYDVESSENNNVWGLDSTYGIDVNGTASINTKFYDPTTNGLNSLVYIETSSQLNKDGIGATILKMHGKPGTLWGEAGYNLLQNGNNGQEDIDLWPFPNEDIIKSKMAEYSYDSGRLIGKRGFCSSGKQLNGRDNITLTSYIWEYLGNPIPQDIYMNQAPNAPTNVILIP